jgi:predicted RNA-binding Zn-ribbon protein involved in translation (DUF1610 family)
MPLPRKRRAGADPFRTDLLCACSIKKEAIVMTDIRLPVPLCPLCGGSMSLIESRTRTDDKLVDIYKCDDCSVHFPRAVDAPEPPRVIEP